MNLGRLYAKSVATDYRRRLQETADWSVTLGRSPYCGPRKWARPADRSCHIAAVAIQQPPSSM